MQRKKYDRDMRQFSIILFVIIVSAGCVDWLVPRLRLRDFADVMEEEINRSPLETYRDSFFDLCVRAPRCFVKEQEADDSAGSMRFIYNNVTRILLDCYVCRNEHIADSDGGIRELARQLRAKAYRVDGGYILRGPMYENGMRVDGYSHYTKCVARGKLWAVCALIYPDEHRKRLPRLFWLVDRWEAWEDLNVEH